MVFEVVYKVIIHMHLIPLRNQFATIFPTGGH